MDTNVKRVVVFGSGRWARVYLKTLIQLTNRDVELVCYSVFGYQSLHRWRQENNFCERFIITKDKPLSFLCRKTVAIICNTASLHYETTMWLLKHNIPVLVEKPFCMSGAQMADVQRFSKINKTNIFCAEVFRFTSYLARIRASLNCLTNISHVDLCWLDKKNDFRHGEISNYDSSIPVYKDCLPHIFSIFDEVFQEKPSCYNNMKVMTAFRGILISGGVNSIKYSLKIQREARLRCRQIKVKSNAGEVLLDFTKEPGVLVNLKTNVKEPLHWDDSERPMMKMVSMFLREAFSIVHDNNLELSTPVAYAAFFDKLSSEYELKMFEWLKDCCNRKIIGNKRKEKEFEYVLFEALQRDAKLDLDRLNRLVFEFKSLLIESNKDKYLLRVNRLFLR